VCRSTPPQLRPPQPGKEAVSSRIAGPERILNGTAARNTAAPLPERPTGKPQPPKEAAATKI